MFDQEKNGYKRSEVDHYIQRLDDDFNAILRKSEERLDNVRRNVSELAIELNEYSQVVPKFKSEIESLRERLETIRETAKRASETRYLAQNDIGIVLANLITKILDETNNLQELKLITPVKSVKPLDGEDFFEVLATNREMRLDDALSGFDFFDNNPFKEKAEKKLKKIEKAKNKRARG